MNRTRRSGHKTIQPILLILSFFLLFGNESPAVQAHPLNNGYSQLTVGQNGVDYELFIPEISLLKFDQNQDHHVTDQELMDQKDVLEQYLRNNVRLEQEMQEMDFSLKSMAMSEKEMIPGAQFTMHFEAREPIRSFTIQYNLLFDDVDPLHINFVLILEGEDLDQAVMDTAHRSYHYESLHPTTLSTTLWNYFMVGIEHILTGYDHLLFLFSLILIARRLGEAIKIVTAFTIAHSITLLLAALGIVHLLGNWVEIAIALTICYVALENIWAKKTSYRWLLTFAFGLIHGFGFAGALKEIGLPKAYFASSLVSFNLGVEAGQLAVVALVLPLLLRLQRFDWYRRIVVISGSVLIFLIAGFWALERIGILAS